MYSATPRPIAKPAISPQSRVERQFAAAVARRWLGLAARSALYSVLISTIMITLVSGCKLQALWLSLLAGAITYPFAILPILSARKAILIAPSPGAGGKTTIFGLGFSSLTSPQSVRYLGAHLGAGLVLGAVYALVLNSSRPEVVLGMRAATPRHPLHLNERFIFLLLGNASTMLLLGVRDILSSRLKMTWPTRRSPLGLAVQDGLLSALPGIVEWNSVTISLLWLPLFILGYFTLRWRVWMFLLTHSFGLLRPFIVNFPKPSRALEWRISGLLLPLQIITILAARVPPIQAITPYLNSPLDFALLREKSPLTPDQHLLLALQSRNSYYLHFTLMELVRVSQNQSRRKALFDTASKGQPPILAIWEELLLHLGRAHANLVSRGGARTASSGSAPPRPAPVQDSHTVQVRQTNIFRPAPASVPSRTSGSALLSAFQSALDGPIQPAPPAIVGKAQVFALDAKQRAEQKAIEWQGEVLGTVEKTTVGGLVLPRTRGFWTSLAGWVGSAWAERSLQTSLPEVVCIERILDILATLACASLEEDTYGYVQQILPGTMEIIVRHRSALMAFRSELLAGCTVLGPGAEAAQQAIQRSMQVPVSACETSLRRIADAFGESLKAFRFPPAIGSALAEICDVRAESKPS